VLPALWPLPLAQSRALLPATTNEPAETCCCDELPVKSGAADAGLGILAAARALELDFVPLFDERYDLVIPREHYDSALLPPLLTLIRDRSAGFAAAVEVLGGYGTTQMGQVLGEYS
jgi:molybdate-binding protein